MRNFLLDKYMYTILKSGWINNIDHMLSSGIEPSSVIQSQNDDW